MATTKPQQQTPAALLQYADPLVPLASTARRGQEGPHNDAAPCSSTRPPVSSCGWYQREDEPSRRA